MYLCVVGLFWTVSGHSSVLLPHVATNQLLTYDASGVNLETVAPGTHLTSFASVHPAPFVTPIHGATVKSSNPIFYSSSYPSPAVRTAKPVAVQPVVSQSPIVNIPVVHNAQVHTPVVHTPVVHTAKVNTPVVNAAAVNVPAVQVQSKPVTVLKTNVPKPMTKSAVAPVAPINTPVISQFHAQDELGQYSYGYSGGPSSKIETKNAEGVVQGGFSYVDPVGAIQSQKYVADVAGFRTEGTNIPSTTSRKRRSVSGTFIIPHTGHSHISAPLVNTFSAHSTPTFYSTGHATIPAGVPGYVVRGYIVNQQGLF